MYISNPDCFLAKMGPRPGSDLMLSPNIHPGLSCIFCGLNFHQERPGRRAQGTTG